MIKVVTFFFRFDSIRDILKINLLHIEMIINLTCHTGRVVIDILRMKAVSQLPGANAQLYKLIFVVLFKNMCF